VHAFRTIRRLELLLLAASFAHSALGQTSATGMHDIASALATHQYDEALRMLAPQLRQHPADPRLWTLQGLALDGAGKTSPALASFDRALALDPKFLPALEGAAQAAYLRKDARAPRYVDRLLALTPENPVANAMAGALAYQAQDCGGAVSRFEKAGSAIEQSPEGIDEYADCLLREGRAADAVTLLRQGVEAHPANAQMQYNLGVAYMQNHDAAGASHVLAPLAGSQDAGLLNLLAFAYTQADRPDDAFETLEAAIRIAPSEPSNYLDLAILCLEHNQESRAAQAATAGIARVPKPAELYLIRGVAYAQLADYTHAESDFLTAAQIEPDQPHSAVAMSLLYSDRNQVDREKALLLHQLKLTPRDAVTNYLLADLLIRSGAESGTPEFGQAIAYLQTSLSTRPDSAEAQLLMGKLLEQQGELPQALDRYNAALNVDPDNRSALDRKFVLLRKLHRDDESRQVLSQLKVVIGKELKQGSREMRVEQPAVQ